MAAYKINRDNVRFWDARERMPSDLREALEDPNVEKWAFNAQFERVMTRRVLKIKTPHRAWRCTMVLGYMRSFTGGLEDMGLQANIPEAARKDAEGTRLIRLFSMPQRITKKQPNRWVEPDDAPADWEKFGAYCRRDVVAEEALRDFLLRQGGPIRDFEWTLYAIDQIINDRGKPVNLAFSRAAMDMAERRKADIVAELQELTGLENPNSQAQFLPWLRARGYPFADLRKDTVTVTLKNHEKSLPAETVKALRLRQWAARTSVNKHKTLIVSSGRSETGEVARFLYQYAGASRTNRWAGRRVQTQNLARTPKKIEAFEHLWAVTNIIRNGDYDLLSLYVKEPMEALVGTVRSAFWAHDGYEFVVCDLSSIESVVIGFLCDCKRLLNVFYNGLDPYKDFATIIFNVPYDEVTKKQRNDCKPPVLGCGYRLGGGKLLPDGKKSGLWAYAEGMGIELSQPECHKAVTVFRENYVEIKRMWTTLERAATQAINHPGLTFKAGRWLRFKMMGEYLCMYLPSGRAVHYHRPVLKTGYWDDGTEKAEPVITYMGEDLKGNWRRLENHGGRFIEQATQALARDILAAGIYRAHRAGFRIVGHVHDEIITVRKIGDERYGLAQLKDHMIAPISYLPGIPLGAAGWTGPLYLKD